MGQTSAQQALSLHGKQLESDHPLSVMISEPTHRKSRTDAKKNACELRIGNLNAHTTDADLNKLFSLIGEVKEVRLVKNADGTCKGLAFVEMQNEVCLSFACRLFNLLMRKTARCYSSLESQQRRAAQEAYLGRPCR